METWSRTWKNEIASLSSPMLSSFSAPLSLFLSLSLGKLERGAMWKGRKPPKWLVSHVEPLGYSSCRLQGWKWEEPCETQPSVRPADITGLFSLIESLISPTYEADCFSDRQLLKPLYLLSIFFLFTCSLTKNEMRAVCENAVQTTMNGLIRMILHVEINLLFTEYYCVFCENSCMSSVALRELSKVYQFIVFTSIYQPGKV